MAEECIFCKIVRKEAKCYLVYEDDRVLSFLDIRPINKGHALVIPKQHYENIHDIPEDLLQYVYKIVKKISEAEKKVFNPAGISVAQNNGKAAGQVVFHFHTHVIPKDHNNHQRTDGNESELTKTAEELKRALQ